MLWRLSAVTLKGTAILCKKKVALGERNLVPLVLVNGASQLTRSPSELGGSDFGTKSLPGSDIWSRPDNWASYSRRVGPRR
jgi:hypothetical protein